MGASSADQWLNYRDLQQREDDLSEALFIAVRALKRLRRRADVSQAAKAVIDRALRGIEGRHP